MKHSPVLPKIFSRAVHSRKNRVLITLDINFANQAYAPHRHAGIVVLRLPTQEKATLLFYVRKAIPVLRDRSLSGEFGDCST